MRSRSASTPALVSRLPVVGAGIVAALVLVSGLAKFADLSAFADALRTWRFVPAEFGWIILLVVPSLEVLGAGAFLLGVRRRLWASVLATMMLLFTIAYAWHWASGERPDCGCFGRLAAFEFAQREGVWLLGRNAVLLALLIPYIFRAPRYSAPRPTTTAAPSLPQVDVRRAFTLLEAMLVVALVGILVALLTPRLVSVRSDARRAAAASDLRQHAAVFAAYANDFDQQFPYFTDPRATYSVVRSMSAGIAVEADYFEARYLWNVALADNYYDGVASGRQFHPPDARPEAFAPSFLTTSYQFSCTLIAHPDFWRPETRRVAPVQFMATRLSDVQFPSAKGVLVLDPRWYRAERATPERLGAASFADGHAQALALSTADPGMRSGDGDSWRRYGGHPIGLHPFMHTLEGVRGRDLR